MEFSCSRLKIQNNCNNFVSMLWERERETLDYSDITLTSRTSGAARGSCFAVEASKNLWTRTMLKRSEACCPPTQYELTETEDNSNSLDSRSFYPLPNAFSLDLNDYICGRVNWYRAYSLWNNLPLTFSYILVCFLSFVLTCCINNITPVTKWRRFIQF